MSEPLSVTNTTRTLHQRLMAGASVSVLFVAIVSNSAHAAGSESRPTVWIELGGQLERIDGGHERYTPNFVSLIDTSTFTAPAVVQRPPRYGAGAEGKISVDSDGWVFSASLRYGRSNSEKSLHQETAGQYGKAIISIPAIGYYETSGFRARSRKFTDTVAKLHESHAVIDFEAGKDVGLGLFGGGEINLGVRLAQFQTKSHVSIGANPDFAFQYKYLTVHRRINGQFVNEYVQVPQQKWHLYAGSFDSTNDFRGLGPKVSWDSSVALAGSQDREELAFDWGVNGALLFGRQKTQASHHESGQYVSHNNQAGYPVVVYQKTSPGPVRNRSVVIPNIGGFAGLSLQFPDAKLSLGYRGDVFFGAMDGGIDTHKSYDRSFYGPFATISVGLGG